MSILMSPAAVNWYPSPLTTAVRALAPPLGELALHPFYSGEEPITLDKLDVVLTGAGQAGSVTRMGLYLISDNRRPFAWTPGAIWARLIAASENAKAIGTAGAGQQVVTFASPIVIPARRWFAAGGVDQVATPGTRQVAGQSGQTAYSPLGQSSVAASGYTPSPGLALVQTGVTGALPKLFRPASARNHDSGVGIHRSA